jgi:hypothetical protein
MTMVRSIVVALGAAMALFVLAGLDGLPGGPLARALIGVAAAVGATSLLHGEPSFVTVACGAASPLAFAAMQRTSPAAAVAAMCALWLAPRLVLAPTRARALVLAGASMAAAASAGCIAAAYAGAPLAARAASCVFAGSCLALVGVAVAVRTTTDHSLRVAAAAIDGPIRETLIAAAARHENTRWRPRTRAERRNWKMLIRWSDQRAALARGTGANAEEERRAVDAKIEGAARDLAPPNSPPVSPTDETTLSARPSEPAVLVDDAHETPVAGV